MNNELRKWEGQWDNFEFYIISVDPYLVKSWQEAEEIASTMPMFSSGVKKFWKKACNTVTKENPFIIGGWNIKTVDENGLFIEWYKEDGTVLYSSSYMLDSVIEKGLENKKNLLLVSKENENSPFHYVLLMEPMPHVKENGLIPHFHFQYASYKENILNTENGKLVNPMWYATMCAGNVSTLDRCNIVRALHRLPLWNSLPKL